MTLQKTVAGVVLLFLLGWLSIAEAIVPTPGKPQAEPIALVGGTIHVGNGTVIEGATLTFSDGVITAVGQDVSTEGHRVIDATGQHIYPGFILVASQLGLVEVGSLADTIDRQERGLMNPSVRTLIAYNTDSELIPTMRFNGVLVAQAAPTGGLVSGISSIMQLDAWNWEDAALVADDGVFMRWPRQLNARFDWSSFSFRFEENEEYAHRLSMIETLFRDASVYAERPADASANLKLDALQGLFDGSKRLYLRSNDAQEIVRAVEFLRSVGVQHISVIGQDALLTAADYLVENDVSAIVNGVHRLPNREHHEVSSAFRLPADLLAAGVRTTMTIASTTGARNLGFQAGSAAAYGLGREEALRMITLTAAEILGISDRLGSLESGKDATLFIAEGDALDMSGNKIAHAFINGRTLQLDGMQQQLNQRYQQKYADSSAGE